MRKHPWLVVSLLGLLGVLVLGAFPVRAYLGQIDQRKDLAARAEKLARANEQLVEKAAQLSTDEAIERLARQRYQLVRPGEEAYAILPDGEPPVSVPAAQPAPAARPAEQSWWQRAWATITSIF